MSNCWEKEDGTVDSYEWKVSLVLEADMCRLYYVQYLVVVKQVDGCSLSQKYANNVGCFI